MHVVLLLQTLLSLSKLALLASDENNDAELEGKCQPTIVYELHFSLACGEPGLPLPNPLLAVFLAAFLFAPSTIACSQANFPLTQHTIWHTYPTLSPHTLYDTLTPPSHPTHYMTHSPHPLTPHLIWLPRYEFKGRTMNMIFKNYAIGVLDCISRQILKFLVSS